MFSALLPSTRADASPAVRADHDEIGLPHFGFGDDALLHRFLQVFIKHAVHGDAVLARRVGGVLEDRRAVLAQQVQQLAGIVAIAVYAQGEREFVDHMDQTQLAMRELGQADGFLQAAVGRGAAVDGYENALVHACAPGDGIALR